MTMKTDETPATAREPADDNGETLFQLFRPRPDDPPSIRYLRSAVITMGVVLIVIFIVVIGRIAYLVSRPVPGTTTTVASPEPGGLAIAAPSSALSPDIQVQLPRDARIRAHTLYGNRLSLHYEAGPAEGIMVIDLESGRALSHVRVKSGRE